MAVRLSPSRWLTASCSDPNTSDPPVWRRDQRGPDRQTARLAPCLSCQNRQAANRNAQEYPSFRPFCLSLCALFLSEVVFFLLSISRSSPLQTAAINLQMLQDVNQQMCVCGGGRVNQYWKRYFYSILFYSTLFYFLDLM